MPVVQATIKSALEALYTISKASPMTEADFADGLATIISDAILSANVKIGTAVEVVPATGKGATTAIGIIE